MTDAEMISRVRGELDIAENAPSQGERIDAKRFLRDLVPQVLTRFEEKAALCQEQANKLAVAREALEGLVAFMHEAGIPCQKADEALRTI